MEQDFVQCSHSLNIRKALPNAFGIKVNCRVLRKALALYYLLSSALGLFS